MTDDLTSINANYEEKYGFNVADKPLYKLDKGLNESVVRKISEIKKEPQWMLDIRLNALKIFFAKAMPQWGGNLNDINFDNVTYYLKSSEKVENNWDNVPEEIKNTFERLGVPEAERKFLAGSGGQFESETVYHNLQESLAKQGVIFCDMDTAVREYPEIVKQHFGKIVPAGDNKFAALNTACWSGGSFIYIPKGVKVTAPLQAYFRINSKNMGQFERTLIIADEGAEVLYYEGCFVKGTPIQTITGIKPIEEINNNDSVLTHNLHYKNVYNTQARKYSGDLYHINYYTDSRYTIQVTAEHPILIVKRQKKEYRNEQWKPQWIHAKDIAKDDYVIMPIERTVVSKDERVFTILLGRNKGHIKKTDVDILLKTNKEFFRLAGYYLAEGHIMQDHYVVFTFHKKEREYLDDVKNLCLHIFGKEPIEQKEYKNGIGLILCSTTAARIFKQQFDSGAHKKKIPTWMVFESTEKQKELVKGWWRGDGNLSYKKYSWGIKRMFRINTVSEQLAEQMKRILLRLNILPSINLWKRKKPRSDQYVIYVGGQDLDNFSSLLDISTLSTQGISPLVTQTILKSYGFIKGNYAFVPIRTIKKEQVKNLDVYNFSVEDDESYISHNIIVHNCTSPTYSSDSLHAAVVELIAQKNSKIRYTTIQNWSNNVYNLVTKRAFAYENATVEWLDSNMGSKLTMKYPSVYLVGKNAKADILSIAFAAHNQHQDAGGKVVHLAPDTTSRIISKSISKDGGRATYRGLVRVAPHATNVTCTVKCDALMLDDTSRSDTYPTMQIEQKDTILAHEATVGKIGEEHLFYLMSRGITEADAMSMIVLGFMSEFTKELPMEYAIELNKLIHLEMEHSLG